MRVPIKIFPDGSQEPPGSLLFILEEKTPEGAVSHYTCVRCSELVTVVNSAGTTHACDAYDAFTTNAGQKKQAV
jgi:hypothetical protein